MNFFPPISRSSSPPIPLHTKSNCHPNLICASPHTFPASSSSFKHPTCHSFLPPPPTPFLLLHFHTQYLYTTLILSTPSFSPFFFFAYSFPSIFHISHVVLDCALFPIHRTRKGARSTAYGTQWSSKQTEMSLRGFSR